MEDEVQEAEGVIIAGQAVQKWPLYFVFTSS